MEHFLNLGKTKSTVKVGSWSAVKPPSTRSDNRTLCYQNPQEVTFEEPVKRYSWRDTLTVSLVFFFSENCQRILKIPEFRNCIVFLGGAIEKS